MMRVMRLVMRTDCAEGRGAAVLIVRAVCLAPAIRIVGVLPPTTTAAGGALRTMVTRPGAAAATVAVLAGAPPPLLSGMGATIAARRPLNLG